MGDTTDELLAKAADINPNAPKRELDMLLTTGEQVSVSLMAMAMHALGVPAVSLNAYQVMMHSTSRYGNARFKRIDSERIRHELILGRLSLSPAFRESINMMIIQHLEEVVRIQLQWRLQRHCAQMRVRFIQM